jgi:hypothetical protein
MANSADISSSFVIRVIQDSAGAEIIDVANPGRSFRVQVVQIEWKGLNATPSVSTVQVARIRSGAAQNLFSNVVQGNRQLVPVYLPDNSPMNVTVAAPDSNSAFNSTDDIRVTTVNADTRVEVSLFCIGNPSQSLVVT